MAKISKEILKSIVKECLVEILSEGIAVKTQQASAKPMQRSTRNLPVSAVSQKQQVVESSNRNGNFEKAVKESVTMLTEDPIMQSIFNDTARTSLQEQLGAESKDVNNAIINESSKSAPLENFPQADRWAALAFPEPKK